MATPSYWLRPKSLVYPFVWHRFEVKKNVSDELEQFRIQDLPESRTEDALTFLVENLCKDEPLSQAYEVYKDNVIIERMKITWRHIIKRKAVLVCFKNGSDEIVGINMNFVQCKEDFTNDNFIVDIVDILSNVLRFFRKSFDCLNTYNTSQPTKLYELSDIFQSMFKNFDAFEHYGVNKYLTAGGLAVARQYRRRGIALQLLKTREKYCNQFGIELTLNLFSSNHSNACADKAGFKLQKIRRYDDIRQEFPHFPHIQSDALTLKFIKFPKNDFQNE